MSTPQPNLDDLKRRLGVMTTTNDDQLCWCLEVATSWVKERVTRPTTCDPWTEVLYPEQFDLHAEVVEAVYILAGRLYARRNSPEGVSGWGELGVVRILGTDPDITSLLEYHLDYSKVAGIA